MNEKNIVLNSVEAAKEFVKAASECDFDIDVYFNRIALDAKSLLICGLLLIETTGFFALQDKPYQ